MRLSTTKIELILDGLDCANCASKIEEEIKSISGVKNANINFVTKKLFVETDQMDKIGLIKNIKEIVKNIEPSVNVIEDKEAKNFSKNKKEIFIILFSGICFITGLFVGQNKLFGIIFFLLSYILAGFNVLKSFLKNLGRLRIFDENFLMTIATIGAFYLKEYKEAVGIMLFYKIGTYLEDLAVQRSKKTIDSLKSLDIEYANLKIDNEIRKVNPRDIVPNDIVVVKPGEKIPTDGEIILGTSFVDTSMLTGEPMPFSVKEGDIVYAGYINIDGALEIRSNSFFRDSTISKIIDLVENAVSNKAKTERFMTRFAKYYTPSVVFLSVILTVVPVFIFKKPFDEWFYKSLLFLIISCPCALVISIPLSYFAGVAKLSSMGILVKGSTFIDKMAGPLYAILFDKTGTITQGKLRVKRIVAKGIMEEEFIRYAASLESLSNHPIALAILDEFKQKIDINEVKNIKEFAGKGIEGFLSDKKVLLGTKEFLVENGVEIDEDVFENNSTAVYLAVDQRYCGYILLEDTLKPDVKLTIQSLKKRNIKTYLLTGDKRQSALKITKDIPFDEIFCELLPQDKVKIANKIKAEAVQKNNGYIAFVGDGINDSAVLAKSDIGISIAKAWSDIAINASDIILLDGSIKNILNLIDSSSFTKKIVIQNIVFSIGIKVLVMILGVWGIANLWEAVFADVGVTLIVVINSLRIIKRKFCI